MPHDLTATSDSPAVQKGRPRFAPGVYFDMPHETYLADPALGSTDLKNLAVDPAAYWFDSWLNPNPSARDSDLLAAAGALDVGSAVHKIILEGTQQFDRFFVREPEGDDLLRTIDDMKNWLTARGRERSFPKAKAEFIQLCKALDPQVRIYDDICERAAKNGTKVIGRDMYDRILTAAGTIAANPHLAGAFEGGRAEVSVFWREEIDGEIIRRKARFDYLKPRSIVDLKSLAPRRAGTFRRNCYAALAEYEYPTQAAAYLDARDALPALVAKGFVYGIDPTDEWLKRVCDAGEYAFTFVFWSKVKAPQTFGGILSPGNPILDIGAANVERALANYARCVKQFGTEAAWIDPEPLTEFAIEEMPGWWGRNQ